MKIRYIILTIYLLVLSSCVLMLVTLSKYSSSVNPEPNFPIGDRLHFNYTRGDLYRNDTLIMTVFLSMIILITVFIIDMIIKNKILAVNITITL